MRLAIPCAVVLTVILIGARPIGGQSPSPRPIILTSPTCATCRVELTPVGKLGGDGGPLDDAKGFGELKAINDTLIVVTPARPLGVWGVHPSGRIIWRSGRQGSGPGEFQRADRIGVLPGDSIVIWDQELARLTLLTKGGRFVRSERVIAGVPIFVPTSGTGGFALGRLVKPAPGTKTPPLPVHRVRLDSVLSSFGSANATKDPGDPFRFDRIVLPYKGGAIVIPRVYQLAAEIYDRRDQLTMRVERVAKWFFPYESYVAGIPDTPPTPIVYDAWVDDQDLLWLLIQRAAPTWAQAFSKEATAGEGGRKVRRLDNPGLYLEGVIEVIDLKKRQLLVSQPVPQQVAYALGRSMIASKQETADGDRFLVLHRATLRR
ncbi:MAG: hypothetical protein IPJ11_11545 [Gemmatimonadetes bacterium]|nr:hypothetical protein [Gemmatimonadota bacterium]